MTNDSELKEGLYHLFNDTCIKSFNITPHGWQKMIGATIMEAVVKKKPLKHLCARPTGGGKSLVFNVVASLVKQVTICTCPLLSLGADQTKKTLAMVDVPSPPPLTAFHLDEMKLKTVFKLKAKLRDPQLENIGVIIYMSPQSLTARNGKALIPFLIRNDLIRLIVVDEVHLATSFGNTFCKEFRDLPSLLFSRVTCPMLFLTATCTRAIRNDFEDMMQIDLNLMNWPTANEMAHRCVSIETNYTTKPFQYVMKSFKDMISDSDDDLPSKVIVYSNTRERILNFADSIRKKMNSDAIMKKIDIISLVGTLTKQEKTNYIRLFVNGSSKHPHLKIRVLCATSGVGNAGIDCPDVRAV